jgi:DNA-binding SARP family transcriptional activator
MATGWQIELFGGLRAHQGDRVVAHFPTQKTGLLLAYLAYYHQHPHPREVLIDQLWPDADPDAARASLRVALSALRRLLEPGGIAAGTLLVASRSAISLDLGAFTTDVTEFRTAVRAAARTDSATERAVLLARAVERYRGELLPGHYDAWVLTERQHLAEEHLAALHQLGTALEQSGELQQAVEVARPGGDRRPIARGGALRPDAPLRGRGSTLSRGAPVSGDGASPPGGVGRSPLHRDPRPGR